MNFFVSNWLIFRSRQPKYRPGKKAIKPPKNEKKPEFKSTVSIKIKLTKKITKIWYFKILVTIDAKAFELVLNMGVDYIERTKFNQGRFEIHFVFHCGILFKIPSNSSNVE